MKTFWRKFCILTCFRLGTHLKYFFVQPSWLSGKKREIAILSDVSVAISRRCTFMFSARTHWSALAAIGCQSWSDASSMPVQQKFVIRLASVRQTVVYTGRMLNRPIPDWYSACMYQPLTTSHSHNSLRTATARSSSSGALIGLTLWKLCPLDTTDHRSC